MDFRQLLCRPRPKLAAPASDGSRIIWTYEDREGHVSIEAIEENNGDWTFRFESQDLRLEATRLILHLGSWQYPVLLQRMSPTEVGAKVVVRRRGRRERPAEIPEITFEMHD
jgi:hypothetical protein